jgi:predicted NodU family carbamoyl transferase
VVAALLSQEKIDNIKNSMTFPGDCITAMMKERGIAAHQIDEVLVSTNIIVPHHCRPNAEAQQITGSDERFAARMARRIRRIKHIGHLANPMISRIRKLQHLR